MISAWKRFLNKNDTCQDMTSLRNADGVPPGIQKLDKELQRKFGRGVNYNMKVVIKGDARVGKTSLFLRLKGYGFDDNYVPTENLNVTSINWSYKTTDDIVKIDLWEAIDATTKKNINYVDLKLENGTEKCSPTEQSFETVEISQNNNKITSSKHVITNTMLSMNGTPVIPIPESAKQSLTELSENLDVFKGADAVLLVMDMTKQWTFKYVQAELPKIPKQIPVLVVANHRDQGHHRTVTYEQVEAIIGSLDRSACDGAVMYTEASMKNGFGLKLIDKFFNIAFLRLQERTLLKQLELNRTEYMATMDELHLMQESTNREYEQFLELQTIKRRQQAEAMSPVNSGLKQLNETTREQIRNATMSSDELDKNKNVKSLESNNNYDKHRSSAQMIASQNFINDRLPSIVIGAKCPLPETKTIQLNKSQQQSHQQVSSAEKSNDASDDSDIEEEMPRANPLVASYQSDLDSDDQTAHTT